MIRQHTGWLIADLLLDLTVIVVLSGAASPLTAQSGFRSHEVGFGITLSLPASWVADADSSLSARREAALEWMQGSGIDRLQGMAATNENALLFRAADRSIPANSTTLNVTVGDDSSVEAFSTLSDSEIANFVADLCRAFAAELSAVDGSGGCTSHELLTLENRSVLVLSQTAAVPAAGLDNHRTVAFFPTDGLLFTLNLSFTRASYDPGVVRAILASFRMPTGL